MAKNPTAKNSKPGSIDVTTIGSTGLRQSGGVITEEFLKQLSGVQGARTFREMADNDPTCGAILFAVKTLMRGVVYSVQAANDSVEAEEAKAFVEEVLDDMSVPLDVVIGEACSMFEYGYAPMEVVWKFREGSETADGAHRSKYDDGKVGVRTIALRAQTSVVRWVLDKDDGSIIGMVQQPVEKPSVEIPIEKMLLFRTTEDRNNPEGRSLLRNAYRPWFFKKRLEEIEAVGVERDLAGFPVARIPARFMASDAAAEDKAVFAAYTTLVQNVRRDRQEGMVLPSDKDNNGHFLYDFELLTSGGTRAFDTTKIIDRYDRRIAMSVLADFVFLGQGATGSFALSSDKTELFANAIGSYAKSFANVFNRHLLPRLWKLNGLDVELLPVIKAGDLEKADLAALGTFLQSLSAAGMPLFPDRELENHIRQEAGLPSAPEEGEDDMATPNAPQVGEEGDDPAAQAAAGKPGGKKPAKKPGAKAPPAVNVTINNGSKDKP